MILLFSSLQLHFKIEKDWLGHGLTGLTSSYSPALVPFSVSHYHTRQLISWPNSPASHVVNFSYMFATSTFYFYTNISCYDLWFFIKPWKPRNYFFYMVSIELVVTIQLTHITVISIPRLFRNTYLKNYVYHSKVDEFD